MVSLFKHKFTPHYIRHFSKVKIYLLKNSLQIEYQHIECFILGILYAQIRHLISFQPQKTLSNPNFSLRQLEKLQIYPPTDLKRQKSDIRQIKNLQSYMLQVNPRRI